MDETPAPLTAAPTAATATAAVPERVPNPYGYPLRPALRRSAPDRPPATLCAVCPASVWYVSATEARCYCRVIHALTWTPDEPNGLRACDGLEEIEEQRQQKQQQED